MAKEDFAVVIGISNYPNGRSLESPVMDAMDFYNWLLRIAHVPNENIELVVHREPSSSDLFPKPDDVHQALTRTRDAAQKLQTERHITPRRLYIFFSGHGSSINRHHISLYMADHSLSMVRALNMEAYHDQLYNMGLFAEQLIFYDACRRYPADDSRNPGQDPIWRPQYTAKTASETSRNIIQFILYGTSFGESTYERHLSHDDLTPRSLFTRALREGLQGGAAFKQGTEWVVTIGGLSSYVGCRVAELCSRTRVRGQVPVVQSEGPAQLTKLTVVTVPKPLYTPINIQLQNPTPGATTTILIKDRNSNLHTRLNISSASVVRLPPGWYSFTADPPRGTSEPKAIDVCGEPQTVVL
jgi:hypothetical protein